MCRPSAWPVSLATLPPQLGSPTSPLGFQRCEVQLPAGWHGRAGHLIVSLQPRVLSGSAHSSRQSRPARHLSRHHGPLEDWDTVEKAQCWLQGQTSVSWPSGGFGLFVRLVFLSSSSYPHGETWRCSPARQCVLFQCHKQRTQTFPGVSQMVTEAATF